MKTTNLKPGILIITFLLMTTITYSFFKSSKHLSDTPPPSDVELQYNSKNKQETAKSKISFATSFENDYYTDNEKEGYFYAEVKADKYYNENAIQRPLNISLVIDRSGSMIGDKLENAKKAAKHLVDQLNDDDYISIIIYDDVVDVLQPAIRPYNKEMIKQKIDHIQYRNSTNLMGGAEAGYNQVKRNYNERYINRVLLLSDGLANEGITNPREIKRIVRNHTNKEGISISTFGLGADYNEDLMTSMAEAGMGNYYFINHAEDIAGIFRKELNGLKEVVAQNVQLNIQIPQYMNIEKIYGANYDFNGNTIKINMRDIFSEETRGVLIKYSIRHIQNKPISIYSTLTYIDVEKDRQEQLSLVSDIKYTNDYHVFNKHFNEWVSTQIALNISNEKLEEAMKEVDRGNYERAKEIIKDNDEYISSKGDLVNKSIELQKAKKANNIYDMNIDAAPSMSEPERKVMQKASKNESYLLRNKK